MNRPLKQGDPRADALSTELGQLTVELPVPEVQPPSSPAKETIRAAANALLPSPGEIERSVMLEKLGALVGGPKLDSRGVAATELAKISPALVQVPDLPDHVLTAHLRCQRDRMVQLDAIRDCLTPSVIQNLALTSGIDAHYQEVASKHLQVLLSPFRGCDIRLEKKWTFPDGLQGGPYLIFSKQGADFGLVRLSYGAFSRADHEVDTRLNRFVNSAERAVIKTVFGDADPNEKNQQGIVQHPLLVIGTIQGIRGLNAKEAGITDGSARKFMLEAVASSFQELQRARWVVGMSGGGWPKHSTAEQATERNAFNYKLRDPLFLNETYSSREVYFPRSSIHGVTFASFYPLKELSKNGALQKLYKERSGTD